MTTRLHKVVLHLGVIWATFGPVGSTAYPQTIKWIGTTSADPSVGSNWVGSSAPSSSNIATFDTSAAAPAYLPTFGSSAAATWLGINFLLGGTTAFTLTPPTSGSLTLGSSGIVNNSSASTQTLAAGNLVLSSGYTPFTQRGSGALTISSSVSLGANTLVLAGTGGTSTISGAISGTGGSVVKAGSGTWVLAGANVHTYTGNTTVNSGTLTLDFTGLVTPTNLIDSGSALSLGGGTLNVKGKSSGTTTQVFASTITPGASSITRNINGGTATNIGLTLITRQVGGTVNFPAPSGSSNVITTATNTADTILGGWATVGGTDWATVSSNFISALPSGSYTANVWGSGVNTDVSGTLSGVSGSTNSLRFNAAGSHTVSISGTATIDSGGILVTSVVGGSSGSPTSITISGGTLQGASGADLVINQNNTYSSQTAFVISSVIADNGSATGLTKSGTAALTLSGTNTYTGPTTHNGAQLNVSLLANGGTASSIGASSNAASNLVIDGGQLYYTGTSVATDRLFTLGAKGGSIYANNSGQTLTLNNGGNIAFNDIGTRTLTLTGSGNGSLAAVIGNDAAGNDTSLSKSGTGTWTLTGASTFTGTTTISAGTLVIGAANALPSTTNLTLGGGTLNLGGIFNDTIGTLNVTASSGVNFGSFAATLNIADSSALTWGSSLAVTNYVAGSHLLFGSDANGLTSTQLGLITINGGTVTLGSNGELTAVPEPATYATIVGVGALLLAVYRRRAKRETLPAATVR